MIGAWEQALDDFVPFQPEIHKLGYITNAIESFKRPVPASDAPSLALPDRASIDSPSNR